MVILSFNHLVIYTVGLHSQKKSGSLKILRQIRQKNSQQFGVVGSVDIVAEFTARFLPASMKPDLAKQ